MMGRGSHSTAPTSSTSTPSPVTSNRSCWYTTLTPCAGRWRTSTPEPELDLRRIRCAWRRCCSSAAAVPILFHLPTHRLVGQPPATGSLVVFEVAHLRRARYGAGHCRVRDHVLEEELRPTRDIDIPGPGGQGTLARLAEKRRMTERKIHQHRELALERERQDRPGSVAVVDRVVHLNEVERVAAHLLRHLGVLRHARRGDADVADLARLLPPLQGSDYLGGTVQIVYLQQIDFCSLQQLE